jgi:hypothetical protein
MATIFHTSAWVEGLANAFSCEPRFQVLLGPLGEIVASWPSMLVRSRLTGTRLVCLPYSHDVAPLVSSGEQAAQLYEIVLRDRPSVGASWVEVRGWPCGVELPAGLVPTGNYIGHVVDLSAGPDELWQGCDKGFRYSVRRARRNGLEVRRAGSRRDIEVFYRLYRAQRRRQGLLGQPKSFIWHIWDSIVSHGNGFVITVWHNDEPLTGLLAIGHGKRLVGTHSGSAPRGRELLATPLAMWSSIELACELGYLTYDLGRSDASDQGLLRFKDDLGAERAPLPYYYYPEPRGVNSGRKSAAVTAAMRLAAKTAPNSAFDMLGRTLYRHSG